VDEDLPWVDRSSAVVLGFVARRLPGSRVGFLAASRSGEESFFDHGGLPGYELGPLDDAAADALLAARFPSLAPRVRQRLLAEARGNPLALLELPAALAGPHGDVPDPPPPVLPLSQRLVSVFAARLRGLPAATRHLLLLAVLDGTGDLGIIGAAAGHRALAVLAPAERAGLVRVDHAGRLVFRHPLTRSAVVELSTSSERHRAHRALAGQLVDQPERRVWHLAAAAVGPDEGVAALLEQVAYRVLRRGDGVAAISALTRAAELSPRAGDRSRQLAEAAYIGADVTGELRNASRLLADAHQADPQFRESLQSAVAAAFLLINGDGDVDTAHRLLVGAIGSARDASGAALVEALTALIQVCFFGGKAELWAPFYEVLARLGPNVPRECYLISKAMPDPARTLAEAVPQLTEAIADLRTEADPAVIIKVGYCAGWTDQLAECRQAVLRVAEAGREAATMGNVIQALMLLAHDYYWAGQLDEAKQACDEAVELCDRYGFPLLAFSVWYVSALVAAVQGDDHVVDTAINSMTRWAVPRGVGVVHHLIGHVRALAAMGRGDFEEAYQAATAVSPAGTLASHVQEAQLVIMDVVEAAVHTSRRAEAAAHLAAIREADLAAISPRMALLVRGSEAIAAPDDQAARLFGEALAIPGTGSWPFYLARVQLACGERLRRLHSNRDARVQLRAALETFDRLGARWWAARVGSELRAAGSSPGRAYTTGPASLTPQQRQIAELAAAGLTNKQIGERLFLSPRTVATHLYQLFPKLGITSRAALRDALAARPDEPKSND
jgi:DNA-binding CsgD family transcriptional regulator/tetratricopeptide (TPR) repeat protein